MKPIKIIDKALLQRTCAQAEGSPRKRMNHNFHATNEAVCHRLLNAIEPGSYVPPHRHLDPNKEELMLVVQGRLGFIWFDTSGNVLGTVELAAGSDSMGVDIPVGTFHSVIALDPDTVFLETKAGPYQALLSEEIATWAPRESDPEAASYLAGLRALF